jgi:putative endonuclease
MDFTTDCEGLLKEQLDRTGGRGKGDGRGISVIREIEAEGGLSLSRIARKGLPALSQALGGTPHPLFRGDKTFPLTPDGLEQEMSEACWSVYIIRRGDGSLYTGIATDVERRFGEHVSQGPKAAKYLRGRLPLEIVYRRGIGSRSGASEEDLRIRRMGVKRKEGLVNGG